MTPARTRLERLYLAKLCSKLRSASRLGDWLGESEHSSAQLEGSPRDSELGSKLGLVSVRGWARDCSRLSSDSARFGN